MRAVAIGESDFQGETFSLFPFACRAWREWGRLVISSVLAIFKSETPIKRMLWLLLVIPVSFSYLLVQWICLGLDELFFASARKTPIPRPVFVLGPPRCGTTHLHRVLALNQHEFSTSPAWEVFLAPSVLQKKGFRLLRRIDRLCGSPLLKTFQWGEQKMKTGFDQTHPGSLLDPEEDYFYLLPILACTGMGIPFPDWKGFRKLVPGLLEDSREERRHVLCFYRYCLRKQLLVTGEERRLLSKNASFSSWMDLLPEFFPDAQWICCMRDPAEAVPSMFSTADKALQDFFLRGREEETHAWLEASMKAHYQQTAAISSGLPAEQLQVVSQTDLRDRLEEVLQALTEAFAWKPDDRVLDAWKKKAEASRSYQSTHRYSTVAPSGDAPNAPASFPFTAATVPHK